MSRSTKSADLRTVATAAEVEIPSIGYGTWQIHGQTCRGRVADALAAGYRHVDTAQMYENEEAVGRGLRDAALDREDVFLTTKLWMENLAREAVLSSTEQSLRRLATDYVDLLLIHWPNPDVPLEETLDAMTDLQERGRARSLGVSNFPPSWLERARRQAAVVCNQVEYHPFLSQERLLDAAARHGVALVAYSPLAHGRVPRDKTLAEIGAEHGKSAAQVALRWLLQQEPVGAVPKAASPEHLEANLDVFDFQLAEDEMSRIAALDRGERTIDPDFAPDWERGERAQRGSDIGGDERA
jgi:2,5-diketo-D-gluconate reductase B